MSSGDCLFCKIVSRDIPSSLVYEDDEIMAFDDIKRQAPVHVLVIPKRHIRSSSDINDSEACLVGKLILAAKNIAALKKIDGSGYRIVINSGADAGQEVPHLHLHLMGGRKFAWPPG